MMLDQTPPMIEQAFQEQLVAFIRAFGLHRPEQTPCGEPVSVAEAHALMELIRGEMLTQNALAQRLGLEKSTVSRLVGILERRGWITRTRSPHDARALELQLTDAGQQAAAELAKARQAKFARLVAALPEAQRPIVIEALSMLVEALHESH
jgi:DNA-binding MarR family transcriptional regulator